ncbi:MAG: gliding motility-associated C-terminal domain-containing protein [Flavobacteriales bacterium]
MKKTNRLLLTGFFASFLFATTKAQNPITLTSCQDAIVTCASTPNDPHVAAVKTLGNNLGAPMGTHWAASTQMPNAWVRDSIGEVFGTAIDHNGNVYLASTAMYANSNLVSFASTTGFSIQTVSSGFNFGYGPGGPGAIYKADASDLNNTNPLITSVPSSSSIASGVGTSVIVNDGYGIGNVAHSVTVDKLYATNLHSGEIVVINPGTGNIDQIYDPFTTYPGGTNMVGLGDRLFGIAVQEVSTNYSPRVYFSRLVSAGNSEIHSIEINTTTGQLIPSTLSLEINLSLTHTYNAVTDIAFSERGELLLSEKGNAHAAAVLKYVGDHLAWSIVEQKIVSKFDPYDANSAGGVDFGPVQDTTSYQCDELIWAMSNAIAVDAPSYSANTYYGAISQPNNGYLSPATYHLESHIVNLGVSKGRFGDIEFYDCSCEGLFVEACDSVDINLTQFDMLLNDTIETCCYEIELINNYHGDYFSGFEVDAGSASIIHSASLNANLGIQPNGPHSTSFIYDNGQYMPLTKDESTFITVCFDGKDGEIIDINFIGTLPQNDTVCTKQFELEACAQDIPATCALVTDQVVECVNGIYEMSFTVENLADFTMRGITIYSIDSNLYPYNDFLPIADLLPDSTGTYTIPMQFDGFNTDTAGNIIYETCFMFSVCDLNTDARLTGIYPEHCCIDSIAYCVTIPDCGFGQGGEGCYGIEMEHSQVNEDCCFDLSLNIAQVSTPISCINFTGQAGAQFAIFSGWNIQPGVTSNHVQLCSPGDYLSPGTYDDFANFCLTGYATNPYEIAVEYLDTNGIIVCTDTLKIESQCDLVEPECINFTNYAIECQGDSTVFSFDIHNNSTFDVKQFEIRNSDTNISLSQTLIVPDSAIAQGQIQGRYQILIENLSSDPIDELCLYLTAHNNVYDSLSGTAATMCCTDSLGSAICLDLPNCGPEPTECCTFDHLIIPNGLTPNGDQQNDLFVIQGIDGCGDVSISVMNRWGNEVYSNDKYTNTWDGKTNAGDLVLQGTYYVTITLDSGLSKVQFIDIRY